jgi:uncharacterized protein
MSTPIVFFDIAGPDSAKQHAFYSKVFGWEIGADGAVSAPLSTEGGKLKGTFRKDPADALLYFGVPDINATIELIKANGGTIDAPRFAVPGVVILALFRDPAGNRMGLVEMDGERAKVP